MCCDVHDAIILFHLCTHFIFLVALLSWNDNDYRHGTRGSETVGLAIAVNLAI